MDTTLSYDACLAFLEGEFFLGFSCGRKGTAIGEVCFTTGTVGYQHTITDPSFSNQIILFAFPHIGNIAVNSRDYECSHVLSRGIVLRERPQDFSHHLKVKGFLDWLEEIKLVGIYGVDTRAITRMLRSKGNQPGIIFPTDALSRKEALALLREESKKSVSDLASSAVGYARRPAFSASDTRKRVYLIDFGIKDGIARYLEEYFSITIVAGIKGFSECLDLEKCDGIVLSNGPGDPCETYSRLRDDFSRIFSSNVPVLGICLGHQLTVLAFGCKTAKMFIGHRGANHPVINLERQRVEITSQNHGFVLDESTLNENIIVTHRSLFDNSVEGIRIKGKKIFSVQYHPEGSPGTHDSHYIFSEFRDEVASR